MASLHVFCVHQELAQWLTALCDRYALSVLVFRGEEPKVRVLNGAVDPRAIEDAYQLFLGEGLPVPWAEIRGMGEVNQRGWGLVNVRGGGVRSIGLETRLVITEIHGNDFAGAPFKPSRYVRWLKTHLKKTGAIKGGVVSSLEPDVSAGPVTQRDVYYTDEALSLHRQGVRWRQLDPKARGYYHPTLRDKVSDDS